MSTTTEALFQELLQIKSYSHAEQELAQYIIAYAREHAIPVVEQDQNIIFPFLTGSKKCLIFNAHMDTVSAEDHSLWEHPPYGPGAGVIVGDTIYGLGASDMKATIVSFLELACEWVRKPPPIDIFFTFVTREEVDGYGSKVFVDYFKEKYQRNYQSISAVIGEPTDLLYTEIGHRGHAFVNVTTQGDAGHASRSEEIESHAIEEMLVLAQDLQSYFKSIQEEYRDDILGLPSFTLTGIRTAEKSPNKIPSRCYATWDIRTTPALHTVSSLIFGNCCLKILTTLC